MRHPKATLKQALLEASEGRASKAAGAAWVTFLTFLVRLRYPSIFPRQTCPSDVHSLAPPPPFHPPQHPLGATEEAPCHNTFVRSSRKLEARRLREQGQSNKSCIDKHPSVAPYDPVYWLYVKDGCRSLLSTCARLEHRNIFMSARWCVSEEHLCPRAPRTGVRGILLFSSCGAENSTRYSANAKKEPDTLSFPSWDFYKSASASIFLFLPGSLSSPN